MRFFISLCLLLSLNVAANTEVKLALIIGNANYKHEPLKNPVSDARDVAASLKSLGFTVIARENTSQRELVEALQEFSVKARSAQIRVLYYAGHGLQIKGRNYLIPTDAIIQSEEEIPRKSADVGDLLDRLGELRNGMNIVILDACRNNPFNNAPTLTADGRRIKTRGVAPPPGGLARIDAPIGTLIAYATAPGAVALDNGQGRNSVYTKHLLQHLTTPNLSVEQLFKRVRIGVASETQNLQVPWEASSLMGEFYFRH
jgi:uncharacterized caspase-like protein